MSIQFHCPECQELVRVSASLAGLHTRCPSCSVSVPVPEASEAITAGARAHPHEAATRREWEPSPLPEPLTAAERPPSPLGARRGDPAWKLVHVGLTLELAGFIVVLIAFGLAALSQCGQLGLLAAEAPITSGVELAFRMVGVVIVVAFLVGLVLALVGRGLTCTVPSSTHARGLALGSVV